MNPEFYHSLDICIVETLEKHGVPRGISFKILNWLNKKNKRSGTWGSVWEYWFRWDSRIMTNQPKKTWVHRLEPDGLNHIPLFLKCDSGSGWY